MNTDSDDSVLDDHGPNLDSPDSHNPNNNSDLTLASTDDAGIHHGSRSSQQSSLTVVSRVKRCINCGINLIGKQKHSLEVAEVRNVIQRWLETQQVQVLSDNVVCHPCWTAAWEQTRHSPSQYLTERTVGHVQVCICCGCSILRKRRHRLRTDTPREERITNAIVHQIAPHVLPRSAHICHACWGRTNRRASRLSDELKSPVPSPSSSETEDVEYVDTQPSGATHRNSTNGDTLLPNYFRTGSTQRQCFFAGCNKSNRLLVPSALRTRLLCNYNYYVPPNCRICYYHLRSNSWGLLLEHKNPIRTFNVEQIEDMLSLLKNNISTLDSENIQSIPDHIVIE